MIKKTIKIVITIIFIFVLCNGQSGLRENFQYSQETESPFFYYDVIYYPLVTRDSVDIEIIIKVPFDAVVFVKDGDYFVGKYEINILLLDEQEAQVASKIWTQEIRTKNYDETNSTEHYDVSKIVFREGPSNYFLTIGIMDLETKKSSFRKKKLNLKDFYSRTLTISKIFIVDQVITHEDGTIELIPSINNSVKNENDYFYIGFVLLSDSGYANFNYTISDMDNNIILQGEYNKYLKKGRTQELVKIKRQKLGYNRYKFHLRININNETVEQNLVFNVRWYGMSNYINNLDEAIQQLRYIASAKTIRDMLKSSEEEKKEKFKKFWADLDPSPGTEKNELMEEYYRRVAYANEHFSNFLPGWKTDRGMIFILFGPPSEVERHPFEMNTRPYEIWYYYEINRTFVFVDETGFGDYRLVSPIYDVPGIY
ncbi:MAG: GWxTD domain-containing protein [Candidatus Marinimicrobia bacterium]|nr:GWxTD domain-containing protein [Candidatus Neomarinimicrobiota bacterium]